jgi:hypothetical protein
MLSEPAPGFGSLSLTLSRICLAALAAEELLSRCHTGSLTVGKVFVVIQLGGTSHDFGK